MPAPIPIDIKTVKDAVHLWFSGQTGLTTVWADQDAPQVGYPFAMINMIAGPTKVGGQDEIRNKTDLGQPNGQEIQQNIVGLREFTISCQVFNRPSGEDSLLHDELAEHHLSIAQSSLDLPSVQSQLRESNVGIIGDEGITNINEVIEDSWVSRANMDVRFYTVSEISERTGFIEKTKDTEGTFEGSIDSPIVETETFG